MTRELLIRASRPMHMTRTRESSALHTLHPSRSTLSFLVRLSDVSTRLATNSSIPPLRFSAEQKNFPLNRPHLTRDIARSCLDVIKIEMRRVIPWKDLETQSHIF